jgi:hypothetical protein
MMNMSLDDRALHQGWTYPIHINLWVENVLTITYVEEYADIKYVIENSEVENNKNCLVHLKIDSTCFVKILLALKQLLCACR